MRGRHTIRVSTRARRHAMTRRGRIAWLSRRRVQCRWCRTIPCACHKCRRCHSVGVRGRQKAQLADQHKRICSQSHTQNAESTMVAVWHRHCRRTFVLCKPWHQARDARGMPSRSSPGGVARLATGGDRPAAAGGLAARCGYVRWKSDMIVSSRFCASLQIRDCFLAIWNTDSITPSVGPPPRGVSFVHNHGMKGL